MVDNPSKIENPDWQRINTNKEHELGAWAEKFGTSRGQIKDAVGAVGTDPAAVQAYLVRLRQPIRSARKSHQGSTLRLAFQGATQMTNPSFRASVSLASWNLSENLRQIVSNRRRVRLREIPR
jgi:Protein of unknown function (DUF3606)